MAVHLEPESGSCSASCCHCFWVAMFLCLGLGFGWIAFLASITRPPFPFVDLNGNILRGDSDGWNSNTCYNTRGKLGQGFVQGQEETGYLAAINDYDDTWELIMDPLCDNSMYYTIAAGGLTDLFSCYTPDDADNIEQDIQCTLQFQRPESYNPLSTADEDDDMFSSTMDAWSDGNDTIATSNWLQTTDMDSDSNVGNPCPFRFLCEFSIPFGFCGNYTVSNCTNREDNSVPWTGDVVVAACYDYCVPTDEDMAQLTFG